MREWKSLNNWRHDQTLTAKNGAIEIVIHICDSKHANGEVWQDSVYRVSAVPSSAVRAKTFIGETAHSDSFRYARDHQVRLDR
jgi:hypothetical protein